MKRLTSLSLRGSPHRQMDTINELDDSGTTSTWT